MTIKITSNTNITSTSGVTLICEIVVLSRGDDASIAIVISSILSSCLQIFCLESEKTIACH